MRKFTILLVFLYVTVFSLYNFVIAANPASPIVPADNIQDPGDPGTAWGGCGPSDSNCYVTVVNSQWVTSGDNIYYDDGNVGIGTDTPTHKLDIDGSMWVKGSAGSVLTGSAETFEDSQTVTGTGTLFTTELGVGDLITINGFTKTVIDIVSDTSLITDTEFSITATDNSPDKLPVINTWLNSGSDIYNVIDHNGSFKVLDDNGIYFTVNPVAPGGIFLGSRAGEGATGASSSVFIGGGAGIGATNASGSLFLGTGSGNGSINASSSIFIGNAGYNADNSEDSIFIGNNAGSNAENAANSIFIGETAGFGDNVNNDSSSKHSILIGYGTNTGGFSNSIAIGTEAENTASNQLVIGGRDNGVTDYSISDIYFGSGVSGGNVVDATIHASGGEGYVNNNGANIIIAGGRGTGNNNSGVLGGNIFFQTSDPGVSGSDPQTLSTKMTILKPGYVGISNTNPAVALHVGSSATTDGTTLLRLEDANSTCNFTADAGAPTCGSDRTLKTDIEELNGEEILEKLTQIDTVSYRWKTDDTDAPLQYGFIAQNVQEQFPNLVKEGEWIDGSQKLFLSMGGLMPYTIASIKEINLKLTDVETILANFSEEIHTKKLCIGETCIDENQLKAMLNNSGINNTSQGGSNTEEDEVVEEVEENQDLPIEENTENEVVEEETEDVIIEEINQEVESEVTNEPEIINQEEQTNESR